MSFKGTTLTLLIFLVTLAAACSRIEPQAETPAPTPETVQSQPIASPSASIPNLQAEILDDRGKTTTSPLANVDFKDYTYPLPRGWQNPDGADITLTNGRLQPVAGEVSEDMSDEEKVEIKSRRRIGMSYVTTKYMDIDGDGVDEAFVVLKIETSGSAIPQIVYIFRWKGDKPELAGYFRTGDRADGGLKDMRIEDGELIVELYGQDRFLLGEVETAKVTGDEEQLCCPTFFTRTHYKWNGNVLQLQGKRLSYEIADLTKPPLENFGEIMNDPVKSKKYLEGKLPSPTPDRKGK